MKKKFLILAGILLLVSACSKSAPKDDGMQEDAVDKQAAAEENGNYMIARYNTSIYKDEGLKEWAASIRKAERVTLIEEIQGKEPISKVRLTEGTEGFIKSDHLAKKAVVIIKDGTAVYNRNNLASGQVGAIPAGAIGMVIDEKAEWVKISIGELPDGTKIYNRWINDGFSEDPDLVTDAAEYEYSVDVLNSKIKGDEKVAKLSLEKISAKGNVIAVLAAKALSGSSAEPYQYAEGSTLAKVIADSDLKMRQEPDKESAEIMIIPGGSTVAVLEETGEEIELSGKRGKWKKIDYKGTMGWAFGGFLE